MGLDPRRNPNCKDCHGTGVIEKEKIIKNKYHGSITAYSRKGCNCKPPKGKR